MPSNPFRPSKFRFRLPFHTTRQADGDLSREIDHHLDERVDDLIAQGISESQARTQARQEFGDLEATRRGYVQMSERKDLRRRQREWFQHLLQDVRYAARQLRQSPGLSAITLTVLALGIGANVAIFSLVEATLLRAPSVSEPERLVAMWTTCRRGDERCSSSYPDYLDFRDRSRSFDDLAAYDGTVATLGGDAGTTSEAELANTVFATGNYFDLLGLQPVRGHLLTPADDDRASPMQVAVVSYRLWQQRFGGADDVVGSTLHINKAPFTVVGVLPAGFNGLFVGGEPDVVVPLLTAPVLGESGVPVEIFAERAARWIDLTVGRLAPGVDFETARTEMLAISEQLAVEDPEARGPRSVHLEPIGRYLLPTFGGFDLSRFLFVLLSVVGMVLLLACANLANVYLARATARRHEMGLRMAIGASRGRLVRQLLTESVVFAAIGGVLGIAAAALSLRLLASSQLPGGLTLASVRPALDLRLLALGCLLALITGAAFGLVPALRATRGTRASLQADLRGARSGDGNDRLRHVLIAAQIGICVVLLTGSGLFLQAARNGLSIDVGFATDGLAVARFDLSSLQYEPAAAREFTDALVARIEALPGVTGASVSTRVPVTDSAGTATMLSAVQGYEPAPDEELRLEYAHVAPGYFEALGLPVVRGRTFEAADDQSRPRAMVINQTMARAWWPDGNAVGGMVTLGEAQIEVIGVIADAKWDDGLRVDGYPFGFFAMAQGSEGTVAHQRPINLVVRGANIKQLLPAVRREIQLLDGDLALSSLQTMGRVLDQVLAPQRAGAALFSGFSLLALTLAAVGIYGVVSYSVGRRTREMGIHLALGASSRDVVSLVARGIVIPVVAGLAAGLAAALALSRAVEGFMYDVTPGDPLTLAVVLGLLALAAAVATAIPARRAGRADPVVTLAAE